MDREILYPLQKIFRIMFLSLQKPFSTPKSEYNFYFLSEFFSHCHNEKTADSIYVIPWENRIVFVSKRDAWTAGCVGCLVRRLISTSYHKSAKLSHVDSVFCPEYVLSMTEVQECYETVSKWEANATRCLSLRIDNKIKEEFHVLPAPGCSCSNKPLPSMSACSAEKWLLQWPNVLLKTNSASPSIETFHILSSCLPNSATVFLEKPGDLLYVGGHPTAAAFRDSKSLELRLKGESIERYSSSYIPRHYFQHLNKNQLVEVSNIFGETEYFPISKVFNGFHRLFPNKCSPLSSSGVAAHKGLQEARISAIFELIERDALLIAWRLADQQSLFFSLPGEYLSRIRELEWTKRLALQQLHELHIVGVRNECGLPLALTFTIPQEGTNTSPNFGSGIAFNWTSAIQKALCELLQGIAVPDAENLEGNPCTFVERPRFWKTSDRLSLLKKRLTPSKEFPFQGDFLKTHTISELPSYFIKNIFFAELTPPDVSLAGWHVVRAVSNYFEPFSGSYLYEQPSLRRVNQFLQSVQSKPVETINKDPFPYP